MVSDLPDYTRYVNVNVTVEPIAPTPTKKNRDFEKGSLTDWVIGGAAAISTSSPYAGSYCCRLPATGAYVMQALDELAPVNTVWQFECYARPVGAGVVIELRMWHTDGTTAIANVSLSGSDWQLVSFPRRTMSPGKLLSDIQIYAYAGEMYVDNVSVGLATEIVSGTVEVTQEVASNLQAEATARPKGGVLAKGSITTTAAYATVATRTVTSGKTFQLAKILVSCNKDVQYKLRWNGSDISAQVYVPATVPFTDWFPWNYYTMLGNGVKAFDIQAKYPTGGAAGTCEAEFAGEEAV